jgi:hypothetical protein
MRDVQIQFDSNRMAEEYYELLYKKQYVQPKKGQHMADDIAH